MQQTATQHLDPFEVELFSAAYDLPAVTDDSVYGHWLNRPANSQLEQALLIGRVATQHIPAEQAKLQVKIDAAKDDTERESYEYQFWYIEKYLARVEAIAEKRLNYFRYIETPEDIANEKEVIAADVEHWFEFYAFGYDPRARTPISVVPFALFPKQAEYVRWLDDLVFVQRRSGIVEKARDEGATETSVRWGVYHWLNTLGFSMLVSTRKEDEVDSKQNQNTLFERMRFQMRVLPNWQYPKNFDIQKSMLGTMKLANPENGNTMLGEAPVENMGRGGRVTVAFLDEPAFWPYGGYPQERSLSQTTDSIIKCSSVAGRLNAFADTAFDGVTPKFIMDWRDNPFKDKRWYDSLPFGYISPKMSRTTIAQEVDRNYDAAQPGKVFHYAEPHIFITRSEFMKPFIEKKMQARFYDERGNWKIPLDWRVTRTHDFGKTEGHEWGYLIGAQPREIYPLADTHFIFLARYLEPTGLPTEKAVEQWRAWEEDLGVRWDHNHADPQSPKYKKGDWRVKPRASWHSHEQLELRKVLNATYGEQWIAWDTDYQTGIETIEDWFTPIDKHAPNPFRSELYGRCRLIFVAPDDEYALAYDDRLGQHFVTTSKSESGFASGRKELGAYHYPESELGKAVKAMRPVKEFDNIVDPIRGYAVNWNRDPEGLTATEQIQAIVGDAAIDWQALPPGGAPSLEQQTRQDFKLYQAQMELLRKSGHLDRDDD